MFGKAPGNKQKVDPSARDLTRSHRVGKTSDWQAPMRSRAG